MAEIKKYLDKAGLQVLWDQAKAKFIDNAELTAALANYPTKAELATELAKYYTKTEIDAFFAEVEAEIAKKVDKEITSTAGRALIFNEADGGGSKFEAADGTASFAGVNSDTNGGIGAQLYDIDVATNKGAKLDVTKNGIFYTTGDDSAQPATTRDQTPHEIAVKSDIAEYTMVKDADPGQYASIYHLTKNGVNVGAAIEIAKDQLLKSVTVKTCETKDVPISGLNPGDKYIDFEFETTAGTTHSYIAVKDLVKPYTADETTLTLDANNQFSVKAVPQEKVTGLADALAAKADVTSLTAEATARSNADTTLQSNIDAEAATRATEDAKKSDLPGECPPWLNPTGETPYPWFMASLDVESTGLGPDAAGNLRANVGAYNFNLKQYYKWEKNLPFAATTTKAGLMVAADKDKLDNIDTLTQAEIEAICI